jgi:hypothetical protein
MATLQDVPDDPLGTACEFLPLKDLANLWAADRMMRPAISAFMDRTFEARLDAAAKMPFDRRGLNKAHALTDVSWAFSCLEKTQQTSERAQALKGAVNATNGAGASVLHWAADRGDKAVVKMLLDIGADRNASTHSGYTALHWAAARGREDVVELLLDGAAPPPQKEEKRLTPLHTAALNGRLGVVRQLLAAGFDPQQVDPLGRTPLDLAREYGMTDVVTALTGLKPAVSGPLRHYQKVLREVAGKGSSGDSGSLPGVPPSPSH